MPHTSIHEQKLEYRSPFGQIAQEQCNACSDLHGSAVKRREEKETKEKYN